MKFLDAVGPIVIYLLQFGHNNFSKIKVRSDTLSQVCENDGKYYVHGVAMSFSVYEREVMGHME